MRLRELSRDSLSTPMTPAQRLKLRVAVQTVRVSGLGRQGPNVSEHGLCPVLRTSSEGALVRQRHNSMVQASPNVRWSRSQYSGSRAPSELLEDHTPEGGMHMDMWTVRSMPTLALDDGSVLLRPRTETV